MNSTERQPNGWPEWQRYVLSELARLREAIEEIRKLIVDQETEIARLHERFRLVTIAYTMALAVASLISAIGGVILGRIVG